MLLHSDMEESRNMKIHFQTELLEGFANFFTHGKLLKTIRYVFQF